jgi:hypothetical protein
MPGIFGAIGNELKSKFNQKDTAPVNRYEGFQSNAAVVLRDHLGTSKAEIANGMHKEPIKALAKEIRYDPLPKDVRTVVIAAWSRGGVLPRAGD